MNTNHTPGPWTVGLADWSPETGNVRYELEGITTASAADARLIAAAPDLLEALQLFEAWSAAESNHSGTTFWQRVEMVREFDEKARAAIAKATGEQA